MQAARITSYTNDGLTFDVLDEGPLDGSVIIALHGFPERATMWQGVIPQLTAAGYRVLAPNQRGYSPRARPKGVKNYTLRKLTGDVLALGDRAGVAKFHVLSHDWGSVLAWHLAGWHGERIATASILSIPHPRALRGAMLRGQILRSFYILFAQLPWLPEWLNRVGSGWVVRRIAKPMMKISEQLVVQTCALFDEPGAATATVNWYRGLRYSPTLSLNAVWVPTLFVWSTGDAAVGRAAAEATATYVDGPYRFEVFSGVSHWIAEERPDQIAALVLDHITTTEGSRHP